MTGELVKEFLYRDQKPVRTVIGPDGDVWFVLADLCAILNIGNPNMAARRLDPDEVATGTVQTDKLGAREVTIVSVPGMYMLVMRSNQAEAKPLRRWIAHDVLAPIYRDGFYLTEERKAEFARYYAIVREAVQEGEIAAEQRDLAKVYRCLDTIGYTFGNQWLKAMAGTEAVHKAIQDHHARKQEEKDL